ncbi:helix-turn-helix transcriptional regulator [Actinomadura sp. 6K520]|uniref:helix-turn-helix domain-containing protein n=1 Tax=Actinomadura sp. 6K520 TaxID=2530364 RepID=UPI00104A4474|nr:helix-turn-helix transcriptional regulator [Actinomadura sp. 6K520]TDE25146.1 XRE family transcriptional regulator [Actinomadura sp. 6K520]
MSEPEQLSLGAVIRDARKERGWSQTALGEKSGVSRPTIARVESDSDVTTATLAKIAEALGLTLELKGRG